jgi:hypothetical protein
MQVELALAMAEEDHAAGHTEGRIGRQEACLIA